VSKIAVTQFALVKAIILLLISIFMTLILYLLQISPKTTNSAITKRAPKRDTPLLNT